MTSPPSSRTRPRTGVDAAEIGVAARDGIVTLTGIVPSEAEKVTAEQVILRVPGVRVVANDIEVRRRGEGEPTDTDIAPWHVLRSDDKRRARLSLISHFLGQFPYEPIEREKVKMPERSEKHAYDDQATLAGRRFITARY